RDWSSDVCSSDLIFALGAPIGAWLGADTAGAVAQAYGWRAAFFALGVPGVLLGALVFLTIREPRRGRLDAVAAVGKASFSESLAFLWRQRAAFHVIMGSGVCSLWGWGLVWFTPTFLLRTYGLNVAQAGSLMGHIHLVGGVAATVVAAWLMSRPFMLDHRRLRWTLGWALLLLAPTGFWATWHFFLAARTVVPDMKRAVGYGSS